MFSCAYLLFKVPFPDAAPAAPVLCWPQTVKELASLSLVFLTPRFLGKAGAKVRPFFELASTFFKYFSFILHLADNQEEKSASSLGFSEFRVCFQGKKRVSRRFFTGFFRSNGGISTPNLEKKWAR